MSHLVFCSHCEEHDPEPEKPSEAERSSPNCVGTIRRWIPDWQPSYCDCVGINVREEDRDDAEPCGVLLDWSDKAEPAFHDGGFGPTGKRTVKGIKGSWHECLLCHTDTGADFPTILASVYCHDDFFEAFHEAESPYWAMLKEPE